ncbi:MAG: ABC transporter substrate-binding protein [Nitrosopumilus sp. H13]|nr:MAG: ABC transporter substrate-binding protein [Nitrosopumilus sp. H13]
MMRILIVVVAMLAAVGCAHAEKPTHFDSVKFIQYLDENTALEEVRNGNLDVYYYTIPSDRLENYQKDDSLQIFDSVGGSYSILVNPADAEEFNPFSIREVRYALNYLLDRKLIVNELMGGYGAPTISYYGLSDPEYLTVISELEAFNFEYNPGLAGEIIAGAMSEAGAEKIDGAWHADGKPVEITVFVRSDDPLRKSIGEILVVELQRIGFAVKKDFGDLNKAFAVVYGANPADLKWHLYTEGWGKSVLARYDSVGLSQMYAPWFSNMPGFNNPAYWNYQNERLDNITRRIYTADFDSAEERTELVRLAVSGGIDESVRVFLANKVNQYVANERISGIVNDFGAGVPSRFTPINARADGGQFTVGVKQIYQGAWNPVMGLTDTYSQHIWRIVHDPGTFKHPFTGEVIPVRTSWSVDTAGPDGSLDVPHDAILWNPETQMWAEVGPGASATSSATFDLAFGNWHHGEGMDVNDVLYSLYFTTEWGTQSGADDRTVDAEFTPRAAQSIQTIKGIRVTDADTIEVYVDYWHFDEGEIAGWADLWSTMPWEVYAAMEQAVIDGKVSYSRSGATSKNIGWLSLLIPNDAALIREYLEGFKESGYVPAALDSGQNKEYFENRYDAAISWIDASDHAVISNGPYYMESYAPESRTITVGSFADETYPFASGKWSEFEEAQTPQITGVQMADSVQKGRPLEIKATAIHSDSLMYFLADSTGAITASGEIDAGDGPTITIPADVTAGLGSGASSIKIFAVSESVLKPDFYESSFIVTDGTEELQSGEIGATQTAEKPDHVAWVFFIFVIAAAAVFLARRRLARTRAESA